MVTLSGFIQLRWETEMRKDAKGNRLFKRLTVKVQFPADIFGDKTFIQKAPAGKGFHAAGIQEMLENLAEQLDTLYPFWDFTVVEMSPIGSTARYTFTFAGYRAGSPETSPAVAQEIESYLKPDSTTLALELPQINNDSADAKEAAETQQDSATQEAGGVSVSGFSGVSPYKIGDIVLVNGEPRKIAEVR
jgi:hypothetical protein